MRAYTDPCVLRRVLENRLKARRAHSVKQLDRLQKEAGQQRLLVRIADDVRVRSAGLA